MTFTETLSSKPVRYGIFCIPFIKMVIWTVNGLWTVLCFQIAAMILNFCPDNRQILAFQSSSGGIRMKMLAVFESNKTSYQYTWQDRIQQESGFLWDSVWRNLDLLYSLWSTSNFCMKDLKPIMKDVKWIQPFSIQY